MLVPFCLSLPLVLRCPESATARAALSQALFLFLWTEFLHWGLSRANCWREAPQRFFCSWAEAHLFQLSGCNRCSSRGCCQNIYFRPCPAPSPLPVAAAGPNWSIYPIRTQHFCKAGPFGFFFFLIHQRVIISCASIFKTQRVTCVTAHRNSGVLLIMACQSNTHSASPGNSPMAHRTLIEAINKENNAFFSGTFDKSGISRASATDQLKLASSYFNSLLPGM